MEKLSEFTTLKTVAEAAGLRIGTKIRYTTVQNKQNGQISRVAKKGQVVGIYPYIFLVQWDRHSWKNAFQYNVLSGVGGERIEIIKGGQAE